MQDQVLALIEQRINSLKKTPTSREGLMAVSMAIAELETAMLAIQKASQWQGTISTGFMGSEQSTAPEARI